MRMWRAKPGRKQSLMEQLVRREWETRHAATEKNEEVPFFARLDNAAHTFELQSFFDGPKHKRLLRPNFARMKAIPREHFSRTIEVAFNAALHANQLRQGEELMPDFEKGIRLSENARQAVDELLTWLSPHDPMAWRAKDLDRAARAILTSVNQAHFFDENSSFEERTHTARESALALVRARQVLRIMPDAYAQHRKSLAAPNVGEAEKSAFVWHLAEAWFFFCGRIPGQGDSPFRKFVGDAWADIGGKVRDPNEKESFTRAIRDAVEKMKTIDPPTNWFPPWMTCQTPPSLTPQSDDTDSRY